MNQERFCHWAAWLSFAIAIVGCVADTYSSATSLAKLQHADFQYLAAFFNDITSGGKLSDWALPPSPYFFPDLGLYALLRLFSARPEWTSIGAMVLMPVLLAIPLSLLARQASRESSSRVLAVYALVFIAYVRGVFGVGGMLILSCHAGQAATALWCLVLLLKPTRIRVGVVSLLALAAAASDPLFVFGALAPMCLFVLLCSIGLGRWFRWLSCILFAASSVAGLAIRSVLPVAPPRGATINWGRSADALRAFMSHISDPETVAIWVALVLSLVALAANWKNSRARTVVVGLLAAVFTSLFGVWLIGAEVITWWSRYLVLVHLCLVLLVTLSLNAIPFRRVVSWSLIATALAGALLNIAQKHSGLANIGTVRLEVMPCFDAEAAKQGITRCVATYWLAKPVSVLALKPVTIIQTDANGIPNWWITTLRHNKEGEPVDCAVLQAGEVPVFVANFGAPSTAVACSGGTVLTYSGEAKVRLNMLLQPRIRLDVPRQN